MRNFCNQSAGYIYENSFLKEIKEIIKYGRILVVILLLITINNAKGQSYSGTWDGAATVGSTGYTDHGNGVIQFLNSNVTACVGAAVHETSSTYNPTSGTSFSKCYQVFFGCPGNDNIGSDANGDGMAFSFWKSTATYNINNGNACGGGLGYMGSASDGKMITIEFDTWSSQCNSNFDCVYGGGTSGDHDEIALQRDGNASDAGKITSVDAGNLEDGLEHTVCITYNPTTHKLTVTIDGSTMFNYDLTGSPYDLQTYFGNVGLNQTWSSGQNGAFNPATVSDGVSSSSISSQLGGTPLCPSGVAITSPDNGAAYGGCSVSSLNITATATPPAGNTVSYVEFFVDGVSIGTDNTATNSYDYGVTWNSPSNGSHSIYAIAHYTPSSTSTTSSSVSVTIGSDIEKTSTVPTIDGTAEALWNSYTSFTLAQGYNSAPDLAATYRLMYDATNLYVLVDVTDNSLQNPFAADASNYWKDDAVEIYIDIGNDKSGSYGSNDYQYALVWNKGSIIETKHGATSGVVTGQTTKAGNLGYTMEFKFPWSTLGGTPTAGSSIGFDISINDDDAGTGRTHQLSWHDATFGEWNNPSLFGTLQFSNCDPLPVKLISFGGEIKNGVSVLSWNTSTEQNNERFIIERSNDIVHWNQIGEVKGAGSSNIFIDYNFTDYTPINEATYYRLKQIDFNGSYSYSNTIELKPEDQLIYITPNPFENLLTINTLVKGEISVKIYDLFGRLLYQTTRKNSEGSFTIYPDLQTGTYLIIVQTETSIEQRKIVKK